MKIFPFLKKRFSSFQIIIFGFLFVIFMGSILLMLPVSSKSGEATSFSDALFTATSATCVTGLVVHDTATYWSTFGQGVILLLIQIGGLGVITIALSVVVMSGKKVGLMQRCTLQDAIAAPDIGGIIKLIIFILKTTFLIEFIGAFLMLPVFWKDFGIRGIWYALFHSISAFCNAGFDLMGTKGSYVSLTGYCGNIPMNLVIMSLIIIGGIGSLTWFDVRSHGIHIRKYRMQSKVILVTTAVLILLPFLFFLFGEFSSGAWGGMTMKEKVMAALFQTVTPRTAGFNTVDLSLLSERGQAVTVILMLVGGSPGSTAGGIKTTTVAVLFVTLAAVCRKKESAECFGRRIGDATIKNAAVILLMYLVLFLTGAFFISCLEQLPISVCLFEAASAVGTVGLSLGITSTLGAVARLVLIVLMFFGRVGGLTLAFAAFSGKENHMSRLPQEKITVG